MCRFGKHRVPLQSRCQRPGKSTSLHGDEHNTLARLNDITNSADPLTLIENNNEILTEELFKVVATYQNGAPNTVIGPPTTGAHVLNELWKDSLGSWFVCTGAGTPGTWLQIKAAPVSADPSTGTIPTGYMIWNVATGTFKRHAGAYSWEVIVGGAASQKIGFWGAAPVVQPSGAAQAAVTLGNTDGAIGGLTIGATYSQAELQALRDKCEELADDVRALSTLVHALRTALVGAGIVKGGV